MQVTLLAAYTKDDYIIGSQGKIPWNLPGERIRFKAACNGKMVVMGRKTFEEIGHPLSYCTIIIVSRSLKSVPQGCLLAKSLEQAIDISLKNQDEVLIAGGQSLYEKAMPLATKILATEISLKVSGDTYFPKPDSSWKKTILESKIENNISYDYVEYIL